MQQKMLLIEKFILRIYFKRNRFQILLVPYGAGLNGVVVEKLVVPNNEGAVPNFRFD